MRVVLLVLALVLVGASAEAQNLCDPRWLETASGTAPASGDPDGRGGSGEGAGVLPSSSTPPPSSRGLGFDQINRRFAAACAAAGLEDRGTAQTGARHAGRRPRPPRWRSHPGPTTRG